MNRENMKANKSQEEAVLRAHSSTEDNQQDQEKLLRPTPADQDKTQDPAASLNESHQKKMEAFQNLRKMDAELAKNKKINE